MEPSAERFNQSGVPEQLNALRQWVVWKYEDGPNPEGKPKKVPYTPGANAKAKVDGPSTWRSLDEAVAGCETSDAHYDGIGYVFCRSDPFAGVDLDGCVGADGTITQEAKAILARLNSYSEYSPSGKGVKIWVEGRLPDGKIAHTAKGKDFERIEVYDRARYFTFTGRHVDGTPAAIEGRQDELMTVYGDYFGAPECPPQTDLAGATDSAAMTSRGGVPATPANDVATDGAIIARLRSDPEVRDRFSLLFDYGDLSSHDGDDSRADLALCSLLSAYSQDAGQVDRIFRRSKLIRPKWDEVHGASTYGDMTTQKALQSPRPASSGLGWHVLTLSDMAGRPTSLAYVVADLIPQPSLCTFFGAATSLKSLLLADMGICVAAGIPWLPSRSRPDLPYVGMDTTQVPVLWIDLDNGMRRSSQRFIALMRSHLAPETTPFYYVSMPPLDASDPNSVPQLAAQLKARQIGLCVIDNLGAISGGADENSSQMIPVMGNLRRVTEETGAAVVLIHHRRKGDGRGSRAGESLRGHSSIEAALDLAFLFERQPDSNRVVIRSAKTRDFDVPPFCAEFRYNHRPGTRELEAAAFYAAPVGSTGPGDQNGGDLLQAIVEVVTRDQPVNQTRLVSEAKKLCPDASERRIKGAIGTLVAGGRMSMGKGSKNAKLYQMPETPNAG